MSNEAPGTNASVDMTPAAPAHERPSGESPGPQSSALDSPPPPAGPLPVEPAGATTQDPQHTEVPSRGVPSAEVAGFGGSPGVQAEQYLRPPSVPPPTAPLVVQDFRVAPPRPVLGGALWVGGVILWAYVIVGEWVVNLKLPELMGAFVMLLALGVAWVSSVKSGGVTLQSSAWPKVAVGVLGLIVFVMTVMLTAALFGSTRRSSVAAVSMALWFASVLSFWMGRKLTRRGQGRPRGIRLVASVALWITCGAGTLIALASILARG